MEMFWQKLIGGLSSRSGENVEVELVHKIQASNQAVLNSSRINCITKAELPSFERRRQLQRRG